MLTSLELVLLLDGVRVGGSLGGVDELVGEALGDGLDVPEGGLSGSDGEERDGLVDSSEGRDIDGLSSDSSGGSDSGRVLSGSGVDDGINENLDGVLVGEKVDNLERVGDDSDGHELLSVVSSLHHQGVDKSGGKGSQNERSA